MFRLSLGLLRSEVLAITWRREEYKFSRGIRAIVELCKQSSKWHFLVFTCLFEWYEIK